MFPIIAGKPPKWMVYFMENPIKMDDLGGKKKLFLVQHPSASWTSPVGLGIFLVPTLSAVVSLRLAGSFWLASFTASCVVGYCWAYRLLTVFNVH